VTWSHPVSNFLAQLFQSEKKLWKSSGVGVLNIYFQPLTDPPAIAIGLERWSGSVVFLVENEDAQGTSDMMSLLKLFLSDRARDSYRGRLSPLNLSYNLNSPSQGDLESPRE